MDGKKVIKWVTVAAVVVATVAALYIMYHGLGLSEKFDFGAGAYYYADIPGFERILRDDLYETRIPYWVYVLLFLSWGWLMWRLWVWVDHRGKK